MDRHEQYNRNTIHFQLSHVNTFQIEHNTSQKQYKILAVFEKK